LLVFAAGVREGGGMDGWLGGTGEVLEVDDDLTASEEEDDDSPSSILAVFLRRRPNLLQKTREDGRGVL
jgi:hypothetical protein